MVDEMDILEPIVEQDQEEGPGPKQPIIKNALSLKDTDRQRLDGIVQKMVQNKESDENIRAVVEDFKSKYGKTQTQTSSQPITVNNIPEHQIQHTSVQDLRHLQDMANTPIKSESTAIGGVGGSGESYSYNQEDVNRNKAYKAQYEKATNELSQKWNTSSDQVKGVLTDFPGEQDEDKLKGFAQLSKENPVAYSRLKNANDIREEIAKSGSHGIDDANVFNHLQNATSYEELVSHNIPIQKEIMATHNLGPQFNEKLKETQRPLINSLDPGLNVKYWNSTDKEYGLTLDEYAGLETERLFNPNQAARDEGILKHSRGIGQDGKANPLDMSKQSYEYQRGVENVKYNLEQTGRENKARFIAQNKPQIDKQVENLKNEYQAKVNNASTYPEQQQLIQEFANQPIVQEANKLEDAVQDLKYAEHEDERRYPLNLTDQATRLVKDAMDDTNGFWSNATTIGKGFLQGAGESGDNILRWIKNTAINIAANEKYKAFNNATNIGHQSLTELASYEPKSFTSLESPLIVPRGTIEAIQGIFKDPAYTSDQEREQHAITYIRNHFDQLQSNPKAGQQNLTGKAVLFQAANVMGQILGIANQSFMLGGVIGDATKLQQMATAFTPMYMSTQNQMYEQALKNGDENPLLKSNIDAAIISLASLINPDLKVVKGMMGAETGVGKLIAGIDESTWNKVLSENKPWVDRTIAAAKATGRQLGLANLQYGLVAPTAEYLAHKSILNEDANLGDMIKDGVIQTNISMALPAFLHGVWGGVKATEVNPNQKYALVEAGLNSDQQIELIDSKIKSGQISEVVGHEMKQTIKHAAEILLNSEMVKTDGTPMNENEVANTVYSMLRKKVLENKMKTAAEPVKPVIEEKIHEINQDIASLHTSESDKQKNELNKMLTDNMDRIKEKMPAFEGPIREAVKYNNPEEVFKMIADQAQETTKVDGKEISSRSATEDIFGKELVEKAIELSKQKSKTNEKTGNTESKTEEQVNKSQDMKGQPTDIGNVPTIKPLSEEGNAAIKEAFNRRKEVEDAGFNFLEHEENPYPTSNTVAIGDVGLRWQEHGKGLGTLGYILKGEEYLKQGKHIVSTPEYRTDQATGVWKKLVKLGLATETSPGNYKYGEGGILNRDSFLESRHADTIHDEQGIVSGPNNKELSAKGRRDANDLANDVKEKGITNIITSGLKRSKETGDRIAEKIGAKVENRPALNTMDIGEFDGITDEEWKGVQKWFVENPNEKVYDGPIEKFKGKKVGESVNEYAQRVIPEMERIEKESGPETLLINHSNNMMLWEAYKNNGRQWNDQARKDYIEAKKPEPATLTNQINVSYPKITNVKLKENIQLNKEETPDNPESNQAAAPQITTTPKEEVDEWPFKEEPFDLPAGIKKAISEAQRAIHLLPSVELKSIGNDSEVLAAGKKAVDEGKINPREVAVRVIANHGIYTTDEAGAMQYYAHQLRTAEDNYHTQKTEAENILSKDPENTAAFYAKITAEQKLGQLDDETDALTKANRINSRSWGNLGNIMQIETDASFSPTRVRSVIKDNYGGKIPEKVQERLDKANADRDKAISDLKTAKEKVALLQLQKDATKEESIKSKKTISQRKADLKEERVKLIEELKSAIRKDTGTLGSNPLPVNTLQAISKLALNYFKDGVVTLEGLTNKVYDDLKDIVTTLDKKQVRDAISTYQPLRIETRAKETEKASKKADKLEDKLKTGDIEPNKRTPILNFEKDTDFIKAKQRLVNAEYKIKQEKFKSYKSKESNLQKTAGFANRLMRLSILSGVKVLEKLAAAATIGSATMKIPEEIMNGIWGQTFPKVKAKADVEMGMNLQAVGKYYSHFFNPVEFVRDTKDIIKSGQTQLGKELDTQHYDHIVGLDFPTDLHQVIKGPPKRAMFEYALTKILDAQQKNGIDITHPLVLESARQRAFARAKYEIFQEKNSISRQFGKWESKWQEESNSSDKFTKIGGAAKSFLLHFAFPVSTVPTNIARRVGLSVAGLPIGLIKIAKAYHAGIENMSTDEANFVGKALTKGSLGIALWCAGFFGYKSMGGLYTKFDPNKQRKDETLSDELQLMNHSISKPWQHALPFEVMQLGATFRHIYEKTRTKDSDPIAVAKATMGSAGAILEQIPVVETPINAIMATQDPYMAKKLGEDLKRRGEPQLLKDIGIIKPEDKKNKQKGAHK